MSIRTLLDDAQMLWNAGSKHSAFALILIAFAATARIRYPRPIGDADAFKRFIRDNLPTIIATGDTAVSFPFKGRMTPIEDFLYDQLRCNLIHAGEIPDTLDFTPKVLRKGALYDEIRIGDPFGMPEGWVLNMATVVRNAPENAALFR